MHVALVTDGITPFVIGGMQKHSFNLCKHLLLNGVEVSLVHCVAHGEELPTEQDVLQEMGISEPVKLHHFIGHFPPAGRLPGHYLRESLRYSMWCYEQIRPSLDSIDFVYTKGFAGWHFAQLKAKGELSVPMSTKFHGYEMFQPTSDFKRRMEAWLLRSPVKYIHKHSEYTFSYGGKITELITQKFNVPKKKIFDIPSGIDQSWLRPSSAEENSKIRFVFVGRYERRKGIVELHSILPKLAKELVFTLDMVGPIPEEKQLDLAQVTYHGSIREVEKLQSILDECHVLLTPSQSEGMPNVILEGMSRSLAVVATDTGAVNMLVDEKNGWLLEPGNAAQLEQAMRAAIEAGTKSAIQKGKVSYERCSQQFDWRKISATTIQCLERAIA